MRKLLFNLHLYTALAAGLLVVALGLTGAIMAFEPELDHVFHPRLWYVTPGARALSLAEISAAVAKTYHDEKGAGERIGGFLVSTSPDLSYQVALRRGLVFVNQYTGEILGLREPGPDFLSYVHQFHLRLLIRNKADTGKTMMSWAGVAVLFLLASGLYLWWPTKRMSVKWGASSRRVWFDLHHAVGFYSLVFLLVLSATGVFVGFDDTLVPAVYKMTGSQPTPAPPAPAAPPPGAKPISPDQALEIAHGAIPGATPFNINVPGPKGVYRVAARFPEDRTPGGRSRIYIDQYTGQVLQAEGSRTAPAGTRAVNLNRAIHTGDIFGIPSKLVMSLASLMAVVQLVSGVVMWVKRLRTSRVAAVSA
jgi:uncharacterized iron-regulated membrane protein